MVAFISTIVILVLLIAPVFPYAKRRPEGTPLTWGEAMVGATYVFFVFFWAYAVVPHQWLTYADAELGWRSDLVWIGPKGTLLTWFPIDRGGPIFQALDAITEPVLQPLRRIIPPIGMIDITPIVAWFLLNIIESVIIG